MRITAYKGYGWVLWPAANLEVKSRTCSLLVGWLKWYVDITWRRKK